MPSPEPGDGHEAARLYRISRWRCSVSGCVCRKLDSAILVMKAAENRSGHNRAGALNRPMNGSIQVQSPMGPRAVVVGSILSKNPAQVRFTERDQMVDTFPPDRADQPFRMPILPRRPGRDRSVPNTHGMQPASDGRTVNPVLVADQISWSFIPGKRFADLLRDPFRRRMPRDLDPDKLAPSQPNNHQNIEMNEADRWHHE
jgi:hypothetical protein